MSTKKSMAVPPGELLPREKAMAHGMKALSAVELMAILFGTGVQGKDVMALCREILDDNRSSLSQVASMSAAEFMKRYKGIGPAKALTLLAGLELGVRAAAEAVECADEPINTAAKAFDYMNRYLAYLGHEEFWVLLLKNNLKPMRQFRVGQGGLAMTAVDPKIIVREALLSNSTAMMLFHNHPSGALSPSAQDEALTKKVVAAAALFDIRVLDHIIIGRGEYYSFHDQGII
ncbi:MAG: DNA repair protein RadC [Muribaculaceae bacterium]|nr:DNA repair protein RadC [Muribaculaceae bacterium]